MRHIIVLMMSAMLIFNVIGCTAENEKTPSDDFSYCLDGSWMLEDVLDDVTDVVIAKYQGDFDWDGYSYRQFMVLQSLRGSVSMGRELYLFKTTQSISNSVKEPFTSLDSLVKDDFEISKNYLLLLSNEKDACTEEESVTAVGLIVIPLNEEMLPIMEEAQIGGMPFEERTHDDQIIASINNGTFLDVLLEKIKDNPYVIEIVANGGERSSPVSN